MFFHGSPLPPGDARRRVVYTFAEAERLVRWAFPPSDGVPQVVDLRTRSTTGEAMRAVGLVPVEAHLVVSVAAATQATDAEAAATAVRAMRPPLSVSTYDTVHAVRDVSSTADTPEPADVRLLLGVHHLFDWDIPAGRVVVLDAQHPEQWSRDIGDACSRWAAGARLGLRLPDAAHPSLVDGVIAILSALGRSVELLVTWTPDRAHLAFDGRLANAALVRAVPPEHPR